MAMAGCKGSFFALLLVPRTKVPSGCTVGLPSLPTLSLVVPKAGQCMAWCGSTRLRGDAKGADWGGEDAERRVLATSVGERRAAVTVTGCTGVWAKPSAACVCGLASVFSELVPTMPPAPPAKAPPLAAGILRTADVGR